MQAHSDTLSARRSSSAVIDAPAKGRPRRKLPLPSAAALGESTDSLLLSRAALAALSAAGLGFGRWGKSPPSRGLKAEGVFSSCNPSNLRQSTLSDGLPVTIDSNTTITPEFRPVEVISMLMRTFCSSMASCPLGVEPMLHLFRHGSQVKSIDGPSLSISEASYRHFGVLWEMKLALMRRLRVNSGSIPQGAIWASMEGNGSQR